MKLTIGKLYLIFISFILGFCLGTCQHDKINELKTTTDTITLPPITDTVYVSRPIEETIPSKPEYIYKYDTMFVETIKYVSKTIDTVAIIKDWCTKRKYDVVVFDNEHGKLTVNPVIQYNKLQTLPYTFIPKQIVVTNVFRKKWRPFVFGGINTKLDPSIEVGTFYRNFGVSYEMQLYDKKPAHGLKIGYSF